MVCKHSSVAAGLLRLLRLVSSISDGFEAKGHWQTQGCHILAGLHWLGGSDVEGPSKHRGAM